MEVRSPEPYCFADTPLVVGARLSDCYAQSLLASVGVVPQRVALAGGSQSDYEYDAARDWADSGLMHLCGEVAGPPQCGPGAIPTCANGALSALRLLSKLALPNNLRGAALLGERCQLLGLSRQGRVSANGSCHLLPAIGGLLALNLARQDDWALLGAWLECSERLDNWASVAQLVSRREAASLVSRGRMLGLPVALGGSQSPPPPWFRVCGATTVAAASKKAPLVVDLSSLWAGPLCSQLLASAGCRVIKLESCDRPDGARTASVDFFDLLNAGKDSVVIDFRSAAGRRQLQQLLSVADIVIESSRPRALAQLGIDVHALVQRRPGMIWLSITGYGRSAERGNWVAYGDDAAISAGLYVDGIEPSFCGDAICDPLVGLHGAVAAMAFWRGGCGGLLDVNLADTAAHCLAYYPMSVCCGVVFNDRDGDWKLHQGRHQFSIARPQSRYSLRRAAPSGADNHRVFTELAIAC